MTKKGLIALLLLFLSACGSDPPPPEAPQSIRVPDPCELEGDEGFYGDTSLPAGSFSGVVNPLPDDPGFRLGMRRFDGGYVTLGVGGSDDVARSAVFQTDGKLVVAGRTFDGTYNWFAVARFWEDGSLDTSFDTDGIVTTRLFPGSWGWAHSIAIDGFNRIVAVGRVYDLQSYNMMVVRYTTTGAHDSAFDTDGILNLPIRGGIHTLPEFGRAVAIQTDSKIVVAGYGGPPNSYDVMLARLLTNGTLDTTFHTDGKVVTSINAGNDLALSLALQTDGKPVVTGCTNNGTDCDLFIARYLTTGNLDTTFHTDGIATLDVSGSGSSDRAFAMMIDTTQKYVIAGRTDSGDWDFVIARYLTTGVLDGGFETDGIDIIASAQNESAHGIVQDNLGRYIVMGRTRFGGSGGLDFGLGRMSTAGVLDSEFDTDGIVINNIGGGTRDDHPIAIVWAEQKLIVVGRTSNGANNDFVIARYNSNGALAEAGDGDYYFATNGQVTFSPVGSRAGSVAVQSDGRVVVGGWLAVNTSGTAARNLAIWRFTTAGILDTTFHTDGIAAADGGAGCEDDGFGVGIDTVGHITVGGWAQFSGGCNVNRRDFVAYRVSNTGAAVASFNTDGISLGADFNTNDQDEGQAMVVQPDGKVVIVGYWTTGTFTSAIARFLTTGALDTTFHTDGKVLNTWDNDDSQFLAVTIQTDGRVLVAGWFETNAAGTRGFAIARYTTTGGLDNTFETDGMHREDFNGNEDAAYTVLQQPDGKILVGGYRETGNAATRDMAFARYSASGVLDTTFGTGGKMAADLSGSGDIAQCAVMARNGKIWAVGSANNDTGIMRMHSDGSLDTTLDTDGKLIVNVGGTDSAYGCAMTTDGRLLVTGQSSNIGYLMRLWP